MTEAPKYTAEYYAQMLGGGDTVSTPEHATTQAIAGEAALAGAEVRIENDDVVRAGKPVLVDRPAPIIVTNPGISAYRQAGLTPGGARFGVDPTDEKQ